MAHRLEKVKEKDMTTQTHRPFGFRQGGAKHQQSPRDSCWLGVVQGSPLDFLKGCRHFRAIEGLHTTFFDAQSSAL